MKIVVILRLKNKRFDQIENLDHFSAELGVLDEEVDRLLVETILASAAAFVPHLSAI